MKKHLALWLACIALVWGAAGCKGGGGAGSMLQAVTGGTNELLVVMLPERWEGAMGDTIREYFGQAQKGLPQGEPVFDLISLPFANFTKSVKAHRNVFMVSLKSDLDSARFEYADSPWARTQKVFKITAPSEKAFFEAFNAHKEVMMGTYLKAERDRLVHVYKKAPNDEVFNFFKEKYDLLLYCPGGYNINKDTTDFVWASMETPVDSRGFIFFQEEYTDESQLNYQVILDRVNEELEKYIPGPLDSTWMGLDMVTPMTAANYQYAGQHYAILVKGLWLVVNDYMGGPFVLNVVLDQRNNRVIYMMGYVYAPDGKKRNMLRQVESIVFSMDIDLEAEPAKKGKHRKAENR